MDKRYPREVFREDVSGYDSPSHPLNNPSGRFQRLWQLSRGHCHLCMEPMVRDPLNTLLIATEDHLVTESRGGSAKFSNIKLAHRLCNATRGNMTLAEWFALHPLGREQRIAAMHAGAKGTRLGQLWARKLQAALDQEAKRQFRPRGCDVVADSIRRQTLDSNETKEGN